MNAVPHVVTAAEMLQAGLELLYTKARIQRVKNHRTNITRFNIKFGVMPATACTIYEDLQKTTVVEAKITKPDHKALTQFLISLYFLRKYPTEDVIESTFDFSPRYASRKIWEMVN